MDNNEKQDTIQNTINNSNDFTRKEWLDIIDRLLTRENLKRNRLGVTLWVVIGALFYLISRIVDLAYVTYYADFYTNTTRYLYRLYILVAISILLIIIAFYRSSFSKKNFLSNTKLVSFFLLRIFFYFIPLFLNTFFVEDNNIFSIFQVIYFYIVMNSIIFDMNFFDPNLINNENIIEDYSHYYYLKYRKFIRPALGWITAYLIFENGKLINFRLIPENVLLISVYSFISFCLLIFITYKLVSEYEFRDLKNLERSLLLSEKFDNKQIRIQIKSHFVGISFKEWLDDTIKQNKNFIDDIKCKYNNYIISINDLLNEFQCFSNSIKLNDDNICQLNIFLDKFKAVKKNLNEQQNKISSFKSQLLHFKIYNELSEKNNEIDINQYIIMYKEFIFQINKETKFEKRKCIAAIKELKLILKRNRYKKLIDNNKSSDIKYF